MIKIIILLVIIIILYLIHYYYIFNKIKDAKYKIKNLKKNINTNQTFNKIPKYYINLDRSKKRKENIERMIKTYNIENIERIKAFDGNDINNISEGEIDNYKYRAESKYLDNSKSELAITMSHILAIKKALDNNYDNIIIMEDDIDFFLIPYWDKKFNNIINEIPEDCELLLLAHDLTNDYKIVSHKETSIRVSGVCYLVTRKGMEKISKFLINNEFVFPKKLNKIIWDDEILRKMNIYHTNKSLFLLDNFNFDSERYIQKINTYDKSSYEILNYYYN